MRTSLVTLLALLVLAAPARAITASADPNTPRTGTTVEFVLDAADIGPSSPVPSSITLTAQPGFTFDRRSVASRCTAKQGTQNACPSDSRIGTATVNATTALGTFDVPLNLYLAKPLGMGDLAGVIAVATVGGFTASAGGRIFETSDGLQVVVNTPDEAAGLGATINSATARIGAHRVVKTTKKVRVKGRKRRRTVTKRTPHFLLTTPPVCDTGTWSASALLTFGDGSSKPLAVTIPCTAR